MVAVTSFPGHVPGVVLDWELFRQNDRAMDALAGRLDTLVRANGFWRFDGDNELRPVDGAASARNWIRALFPIIAFLNEHGIPWTGKTVAFRTNGKPGQMTIFQNEARIAFVRGDGTVEQTTIPLSTYPEKG